MDKPAPEDEKDLLLRLQQGDIQAFDLIYKRYKKQLAVNFIKLVKSPFLAEDLLQDLFLKIWNNREQINPDLSFQSYLFRIAQNLVTDLFRRSKLDKELQKHLMVTAVEAYTHVEENLLDKETLSQLHAAIEELPPKRRQVYKLFKLQGKSYEEISALLGISANTINDHIKKANKFLQDRLHSSVLIPLISLLLLQAP